MDITRDNVDVLLDARRIETAMSRGRWWGIRRNGKTRTWKTDPKRIVIPYKFGLKGCSQITESDFDAAGVLDPQQYRVAVTK